MKRFRAFAILIAILLVPPILAAIGFGSLVRSAGAQLLRPFAFALRVAIARAADGRDTASELREEINRLTLDVAALRVKEQQLFELANLIGFELPKGNSIMPANVTGMSIDPERRALFIDRGAADGVTPGAAVIGGSHWLIGTILSVQNHSATVRLLTEDGSSISALILPEGSAPLVATGVYGTGVVLGLIPSDAAVPEGSTVITGGIEPEIPRGLIIGRVGALIQQAGQRPWGSAPLELAPEIGRLPTTVGVIRSKGL